MATAQERQQWWVGKLQAAEPEWIAALDETSQRLERARQALDAAEETYLAESGAVAAEWTAFRLRQAARRPQRSLIVYLPQMLGAAQAAPWPLRRRIYAWVCDRIGWMRAWHH